jgi:nicotinamide mononucleotide transporter
MAMKYFEIIGACLSLSYILLASQQNILCWSAAVASSSVYVFVFYFASLYAEAVLQIFFIVSSLLGAYWWLKGRGGGKWLEQEVYRVHRCSLDLHIAFIGINLLLGVILGYVLETYTDQKLPYADGLITCFSIGTTVLVGRKILENWLYWIVIDLVCTVVYIVRGLPITAFLYILYVLLAYRGYRAWVKNGVYE